MLCAPGIEECAIITPQPAQDGFPPGRISNNVKLGGEQGWQHGFNLRKLSLAAGSKMPTHQRGEVEVLFVHQGELTVGWARQRQAVLVAVLE